MNDKRAKGSINIAILIVMLLGISIILIMSFRSPTPSASGWVRDFNIIDESFPGFESAQYLSADSHKTDKYSFVLQDVPVGGEALGVWIEHRDTLIYINDELVFDSGIISPTKLSRSPGCYWALVPVNYSTQEISVSIETTAIYEKLPDIIPFIAVGTQGKMQEYCFKHEWITLVVSQLCVLLSFIFFVLAYMLHKNYRERRGVIYTGLFIGIFGIYRLLHMPIVTLIFNERSQLLTYATLLCFVWIPYIFYMSEATKRTSGGIYRVMSVIFAGIAIILTALQITGLRDLMENSGIFFGCLLLSYVVVIADHIKNSVSHRENERPGFFRLYLMIFAGTLADLVLYRINGHIRYSNVTLYVVLIYGIISGVGMLREIIRRNDEVLQDKLKIADQKGAFMLSQMQPHFIYNTMNTIYSLCDLNIEDAKTAIHDFAGYLRHNLGAMESTVPVPFESELNHTKFYLSIEKMRFGDELNVVYDIREDDFDLPPITLQPIVENAVRHGIRNKVGSGTVTIKTYLEDDSYVILVEDDGVGFDTSILNEQDPDDENNHIAIRNVTLRVKQICDGTVEIQSKPGEGTQVRIIIPAKEDI